MSPAIRGVFWGTLLFLAACGPSSESGEATSGPDPKTVFVGLEERLVRSQETGFEFHVTAEGAIEVDIQGSLSMGPDEAVTLTASGDFGGEQVDLRLVSDGSSYEFGTVENLSSGLPPPGLKDAILIGLTRMGILHNLAMLLAGAPPDRADGGVKEWVGLHGFSFVSHGPSGEVPNTIGFSITVDGAPAGTASLELDGAGLPVLRRQAVQFPEGEMRVLERYRSVKIRP